MNTEPNRTADLDGLKLYTLKELETVLGVTYRTLLTYVESGKLKAFKIGGRWKVTKEQLKEFLDNAAAAAKASK